MSSSSQSIEVFYSYSHKDEKLLEELIEHLAVLKRQGTITHWYDRDIAKGSEWKEVIEDHLNSASIILLLVSSSFMASDYCADVELTRAMQRHENGEARVIPVILRPCRWQESPFGKLQALPRGAKPVTEWENRDSAFLNIAEGIQEAVRELIENRRAFEVDVESMKSHDTSNRSSPLEEGNVEEDTRVVTSDHQPLAQPQHGLNKSGQYISPAFTILLNKARHYSDTAASKLIIVDQDLRASLTDGVPFVLEDKELSGTVLRNVTAHNIRFKHCNIEQLRLHGSRFRRVDFEDSELSWLMVFESELDRVHIINCNLTGALFTKAILNRETRISNCRLDGAVFHACTFLGRTEGRATKDWPEATFDRCLFDSNS
jgi:TIR domain-containing protein/pentapeptide repeat protein